MSWYDGKPIYPLRGEQANCEGRLDRTTALFWLQSRVTKVQGGERAAPAPLPWAKHDDAEQKSWHKRPLET